jgi:ssDNA-binding Zn-finger/Zn-ribbon topoisomerase 1
MSGVHSNHGATDHGSVSDADRGRKIPLAGWDVRADVSSEVGTQTGKSSVGFMAQRRKQTADQERIDRPTGERADLECAECGSVMRLRITDRFKYGNGKPRMFYSCIRWPTCNGTHGCHPDGSPLGIPGDAITKKYRREAHERFDQLWKNGHLSRPRSYQFLQYLMGMTKDEAHIARFDKLQCERLIQLIDCGLADMKLEQFLSQ